MASNLKPLVENIARGNDTFFTGYAQLDSQVILNGYYHYTVQFTHNNTVVPLVRMAQPDTQLTYPVNLIKVSLKKDNGQYVIIGQDSADINTIATGAYAGYKSSGSNGVFGSDYWNTITEDAKKREEQAAAKLEEARAALDFRIDEIINPAGELRTQISNEIEQLKSEIASGGVSVISPDLTDVKNRIAVLEQFKLDVNNPAGSLRTQINTDIAKLKAQIEADGSVLDTRFDQEIANVKSTIANITAPTTGLIDKAKADLTTLMNQKDLTLSNSIDVALNKANSLDSIINASGTGLLSRVASLEAGYSNPSGTATTESRIVELQQIVSDPYTGLAVKMSTLETAIKTGNGLTNYAKLNDISLTAVDAQGKANAIRGIELDVNGRISGWRNINNGVTSTFAITADKFYIYNPTYGDTPVFAVGQVNGVNKLGLRGDMIVDGSITANSIAANAVTAVKLQAGSITTEKLAAGSVTADKITARTITSDKIATAQITAELLATNAVTADKIAARAITTDKLAIGGGINLLSNTEFYSGLSTGWSYVNHRPTTTRIVDQKAYPAGTSYDGWFMGGKGLHNELWNDTTTSNDIYSDIASDYISVIAGARYIASGYISSHRCTGQANIHWFNSSKTYIGEAGVGGTYSNYGNTTSTIPPELTYVSAIAPANAVYAQVRFRLLQADPASKGQSVHIFVSKPMFENVPLSQNAPSQYVPSGSTLIDAGQIKTGLIQADRLDANAIRTKVIDAVNINAGDIIASGSITADQVNTNNIKLAMFNGNGKIYETDIQPGQITTNLLAAEAVTADKIKSNAITADKIAVGGNNLLTYSEFEDNRTENWFAVGSFIAFNAYNKSFQEWFLGGNGIYVQGSNAALIGIQSQSISVRPTFSYIFSANISAHRTNAHVDMLWFDGNGAYITEVQSARTILQWHTNEVTPNRIFVKGTAPNNAVFVQVRVIGESSGSDPYVFMSQPMLEQCIGSQTKPSPYSAAGSTLINAGNITTGTVNTNRLNVGEIRTRMIAAQKIAANELAIVGNDGKISGTYINGDGITTLGYVQAGTFNLGNGRFAVDSTGNLSAVNARFIGNTQAEQVLIRKQAGVGLTDAEIASGNYKLVNSGRIFATTNASSSDVLISGSQIASFNITVPQCDRAQAIHGTFNIQLAQGRSQGTGITASIVIKNGSTILGGQTPNIFGGNRPNFITLPFTLTINPGITRTFNLVCYTEVVYDPLNGASVTSTTNDVGLRVISTASIDYIKLFA